jgi:hypothetical protein
MRQALACNRPALPENAQKTHCDGVGAAPAVIGSKSNAKSLLHLLCSCEGGKIAPRTMFLLY